MLRPLQNAKMMMRTKPRFCHSTLETFKRLQSSSTSSKTHVEVKEEEQLSAGKQKKSRKSRSHDEPGSATNQPSSSLSSTPKCVKVKVGQNSSAATPRTKVKKKFVKFPRVAKLDDKFSNQNCNLDILYSGYKPLFRAHEFSNQQQSLQDKLLGIPKKSTSTSMQNTVNDLLGDKNHQAVANAGNQENMQDLQININIDRDSDDVKFPKNFKDLITNFTPYQNQKIIALRKYAKFTPWCSSAANMEWYRDWEILPDTLLKEMKPYQNPTQFDEPLIKNKINKNLELVPVKKDFSSTDLASPNASNHDKSEDVYNLKLATYRKEKENYNKKGKGRKKPILKLMKLKKTLF